MDVLVRLGAIPIFLAGAWSVWRAVKTGPRPNTVGPNLIELLIRALPDRWWRIVVVILGLVVMFIAVMGAVIR